MASTLVAVFDSPNEARQVEQELMQIGFPRDRIRTVSQAAQTTTTGVSRGADTNEGFWESVKDFFGFSDEEDRADYREITRRGATILTVTADDDRIDQAATLLQRHNPVDLQQRAAEWRNVAAAPSATRTRQQAGAERKTTARPQGEEAIPVVEEQLKVGKRAINRGGVRVYSHVTERPVHEKVQLREEQVRVERRPVDRPVSDADRAFQERKIEMTEHAEEAVVSKEARVVEEVRVNKEVGQRTQEIRDTVRRTDVEVEKIDPQMSDERFRPAYEFAREVAADQRYRGREFDEIERDLRTNFERRNPSNRWDEWRDAIRRGYNHYRAGRK